VRRALPSLLEAIPVILTKVRVLVALFAVALTGCSGHGPQSGLGLPVPVETLNRLPAGVFYLLAGRQNIYSANIWEVTPAGREVQLTHNRVGLGVSWFSASPAGIVMADASNGADELAKLTAHGPQWLPVGQAREPEIGGQAPAIDPSGQITYVVPPANYGPAHNYYAVWVAPSFLERGRILYKQRDTLVGEAFGPYGQIAVMNRPYSPPLRGRRAHLLMISPDGKTKIVNTPFWSLAEVIWQPNAVALAVASVAHRTELIFPSGRRQMLPRGWLPLSWSPRGSRLLVQHGRLLGLWSAGAPNRVAVLGETSRQFAVLNVDWLASRAPL